MEGLLKKKHKKNLYPGGTINSFIQKEAEFPEFEGSKKQQWEKAKKEFDRKRKDHKHWWNRLPNCDEEKKASSSDSTSSDSEAMV